MFVNAVIVYDTVGVTGELTFDENGDRISHYTILVIQFGKFIPLFDITSTQKHIVSRMNNSEWAALLWPGDRQQMPVDSPPCGWDNELCRLRESTWLRFIEELVNICVTYKIYCHRRYNHTHRHHRQLYIAIVHAIVQ